MLVVSPRQDVTAAPIGLAGEIRGEALEDSRIDVTTRAFPVNVKRENFLHVMAQLSRYTARLLTQIRPKPGIITMGGWLSQRKHTDNKPPHVHQHHPTKATPGKKMDSIFFLSCQFFS